MHANDAATGRFGVPVCQAGAVLGIFGKMQLISVISMVPKMFQGPRMF
jgi:hypothetical protein